jgi:hypothetical protein
MMRARDGDRESVAPRLFVVAVLGTAPRALAEVLRDDIARMLVEGDHPIVLPRAKA